MATNGRSRMKKPCDGCKRYLDHLDGKNQNMSCFLKHMTANFKHSMVMPNRFLKHFTGKLSGTIKLESPNGSLYDVEVMERFNKVVLRHGWGDFVDAHHIEENNFLLFRHIENSRFEVLILDAVGCEKVFSCAGIKSAQSVQEKTVDSAYVSSSSCHDTTESSESERLVKREKGGSSHRGKTAKMATTSSLSESSGEDSFPENESFESDDLQINPEPDYVLSRGSYLSEAQEERVVALIQKVQPETTVYVAVMRKYHIEQPNPNLAIPKGYAFAHFLHERANVTLQRPGKSKKWHPKVYARKDKRICMLKGRQWLDFVRDNSVQEEDICLLVPAKGGRRFTFNVYLLRAATTHYSRGGIAFQRVGSCHGRSSTKMASAVHIKESTDADSVSSESDMDAADNINSNYSDPSEVPYIVSFKTCLSQSQKKIVEEKVQAIQSEVPPFVSIMKKMNVDDTCDRMIELGTRFAAPYLPHRGQTLLLQCMKKIWKTDMVIRSGKRWFLTGGWATFARDNGLRVGDICLFELKKNEGELTMKVHIISREEL